MFTPTTSPVQLLHSTASAAAAARGAASPRSGSALLIAVLRARACLAPSEHRTAPNQTFSAEKRAWVLTAASPRRNWRCSASPSRPRHGGGRGPGSGCVQAAPRDGGTRRWLCAHSAELQSRSNRGPWIRSLNYLETIPSFLMLLLNKTPLKMVLLLNTIFKIFYINFTTDVFICDWSKASIANVSILGIPYRVVALQNSCECLLSIFCGHNLWCFGDRYKRIVAQTIPFRS